MTGQEFIAACEGAESIMLMACEGGTGNMTISVLGIPRKWTVFVACQDGRDITGTGKTLRGAFEHLIEQYKS